MANPPGEGLYPAGRAVPYPRVMLWATKVPHPLMDMDSSLTFTSPVITRSTFIQLGIQEQCDHLARTQHAHTHTQTHTHSHIH